MHRNIFDTHAHYTSRQFNADRPELLSVLPWLGVEAIIDCGTDYDSTLQSIALAERYPWVYTAAGIHPESIIEEDASTNARFGGDWKAEMAAIRPLYAHPKVVAVGEVGLDYHWPVPKDAQLAMFEEHLKLALELDLPIIVHDREAHADTYALLAKYRPKGVVHCYSGSAEDAVRLVEQGMYIGFTGACTFKGAKRALKAIEAIPADRLLLETDCPYMAPTPHRGKRCDSSLIPFTAEVMAKVKGVDVQQMLDITCANAARLFGVNI